MPSKTIRRARAAFHRINLDLHAKFMLEEAERWAGEQRKDAARGLIKWQENSQKMQAWCARIANGERNLPPPVIEWRF